MKLKITYRLLTSIFIRFIVLLIIFSAPSITAQQKDFVVPDSLQSLDYNTVYKNYRKTLRDTLSSIIYLQTCIKKATIEDDDIKLAEAYTMLSYYIKGESEKIEMLDHAIALSTDLDDSRYPFMAYSFKGSYYFRKGKFRAALDCYLKLLEKAEKKQNTEFVTITKHNIARIKIAIGKYEEALPLFKENFTHIITKHHADTIRYLNSIIPLAEAYRYNHQLDSASVYNFSAILRAVQKPSYYDRYYGRILINEGINLYFKEQYKNATDSINKGILILNKNNSEHQKVHVLGEFYLGKLHLLQQDNVVARSHFLRVDSLLQKEQIIPTEVRAGYEFLINEFRASNKKELQLEYINKLLRFDSIINKETSFVSSRLFKEFDTPLLLNDKELLINDLKGNNKNLNQLVFFLILLSIITIAFLYIQYVKRKTYQDKYEKLIVKDKPEETLQEKLPSDIGVADDIVEKILNRLALFEKNKHFLKKNINTTSLAKEIKTNTKYLSKVINHHKGKNFANYINDLRITYAVQQLKENQTLRNYTIQGIAEEMGFNTAESFSSAFKKSTGIKTSFFIKKLQS
ncbi:hypothetical protein GCM10022393_05510 [Aquimarina addita]|uniref:HTH araC/xylS-type domain-containing protein n=1 Tax=Aquimarina addita TaxID=870485 RepID=A0ABP7XA59_9FLAO